MTYYVSVYVRVYVRVHVTLRNDDRRETPRICQFFWRKSSTRAQRVVQGRNAWRNQRETNEGHTHMRVHVTLRNDDSVNVR